MTTNLSTERLEQFIRQPLDNGLTRGEQMEVARELLALREASKQPFMYGIEEPDGTPYMDECCVGVKVSDIDDVISSLNDGLDDDQIPYTIVPLFKTPQLPIWFGVDWSAPQPAVVPDGYALVPIEATEDMVIAGFESEPDEFFGNEREWEKYQAMSGCEQAAHRAKLCWAAMLKEAKRQK
jgi:hypothetical protein